MLRIDRHALLIVIGTVAVIAGLAVGSGVLGGDDRVRSGGFAIAAEPGSAQFPPSSTNAASSPYALKASPAELPVEVDCKKETSPAAGILFDVDTGEILWERHPDRELPIASLTKMMTALPDRRTTTAPDEDVAITPKALADDGRLEGRACCRRARRSPLESTAEGPAPGLGQ